MSHALLSRREAIAALAATTALPFVSGPAFAAVQPAGPAGPADAQATATLNSIAENLLRLSPESATTLGIDKAERAGLRSLLTDRSGIGRII